MKHIKKFEDFVTISESETVLVESTDAMLAAAIDNLKTQSNAMLQSFYKKLEAGKQTNWNEEQTKKMKSAVRRNLKKRGLIKESEQPINEGKITSSPAYKDLERHLKQARNVAAELSEDEPDTDGPNGIGKDIYTKLLDVWMSLGFFEEDLLDYVGK